MTEGSKVDIFYVPKDGSISEGIDAVKKVAESTCLF